jgi:hypothetical protein
MPPIISAAGFAASITAGNSIRWAVDLSIQMLCGT